MICFGGYNEKEGKVDDGEVFGIEGLKLYKKGEFKLGAHISCYGSMHQVRNKIIGFVSVGSARVIQIDLNSFQTELI